MQENQLHGEKDYLCVFKWRAAAISSATFKCGRRDYSTVIFWEEAKAATALRGASCILCHTPAF
jgi:hypothetical protein